MQPKTSRFRITMLTLSCSVLLVLPFSGVSAFSPAPLPPPVLLKLSSSMSANMGTPALPTTEKSSTRTVSNRVFQQDTRPVMLFDGECNLCNSAVNQMIDWDPQGKLRFAALQSHIGQSLLQEHGRNANDISSIVVVTNDNGALIKSDAVLRLAQELKVPWVEPVKLGLSLLPRFMRDKLFELVYGNRYRIMGKSDECRLDFDGEYDDRFVDDALADQE